MEKLLIEFEGLITSISPKTLMDYEFDVDFNGAQLIKFEKTKNEIVAINGVNGFGYNIKSDVVGKKAKLYKEFQL